MKKIVVCLLLNAVSLSASGLVRYPIGLTSLQVAYSLKDRCVYSYGEVAPLVKEVYDDVNKQDTVTMQATAGYLALRAQLNNPEVREKYVEAYRSIGGATSIAICGICFIFCCKH